MRKDLSILLTLVFPLAVLLFHYVLAALGHVQWTRSESGTVETLTNLFLILALVYLASMVWRTHGNTRWWFAFLLLGTFYFAGEEMSWGQFIFGWETPEGWKDMNDQGETNIHNTWAIFDQLPRLLLTLAAAVGGILIPLYRYVSGSPLPPLTKVLSGWFPTLACLPTCVLAVTVSPADDYLAQSSITFLQRIGELSGGELKECFLALFILLYAKSASFRLSH